MLDMNAAYYTECPPYNPGFADVFFSEYSNVATVTTIGTLRMYNSATSLARKCEPMNTGISVTRAPRVPVFGETELMLMGIGFD